MDKLTGKNGKCEEHTLVKRSTCLEKEKRCNFNQIETTQNKKMPPALNEENLNILHRTERGLTTHKLPYKVFIPRESLLTELFKVQNTNTIYNILVAILLNVILTSALQDIIQFKMPHIKGLSLMIWNFKDVPVSFSIWLGMQSATLLFYYFYRIWACTRINLMMNLRNVRIWDRVFLFFAIIYHVIFLIVPAVLIIRYNVQAALSFVLSCEQVRFMMKTYAFVRFNVPKVSNLKHPHKNGDLPSATVPSFQKYLYFLFAPVLIYRDEYPRTAHIRWKLVVAHFTQFFGALFYTAVIMDKYLLPSARDFGKGKMTPQKIISIIAENSFPSLLMLIVLYYCAFHSWQNAFSEVLRFADREFYQDWWNSFSLKEYYPKWNVIVHDWIYEFIYKEAIEKFKITKSTSTWLVFLVSALLHEYIMSLLVKCCYPVVFIQFGVINTLVYLFHKPSRNKNLFFWFNFTLVPAVTYTLYMFEYYARINCHTTGESLVQQFFIPRSWTCNVF